MYSTAALTCTNASSVQLNVAPHVRVVCLRTWTTNMPDEHRMRMAAMMCSSMHYKRPQFNWMRHASKWEKFLGHATNAMCENAAV